MQLYALTIFSSAFLLFLIQPLIADDAMGSGLSKFDWMLVGKNRALLERNEIALFQQTIEETRGLRPWTGDYNNLFRILK